MGRKKKLSEDEPKRTFIPAVTEEERENQMINLAVNLAEQQLRDGTASSSVICHYLKLGSTKEKIEKDILEKQAKLIDAKTQSLNDAKDLKELYGAALDAIKVYTGKADEDHE